MRILEVAPEATHDLRRAVLRKGDPAAVVTFEGDDERDSFHLAAIDPNQQILGVVTFVERECPRRPRVHPARQLRGMAVADDRQGEGLGVALLAAGVNRCRDEGIAVVWAHARLSAVDFYEAHGLAAEGDEYEHPVGDGTLPHRTVVLDL